jgi:SAM-dependent methyltransferase
VEGGSGALLRGLAAIGFKNLTCIDLYLEGSTSRDGVRFIKATLAEVSETFDVIMYHYALEHVTDLDAELTMARTLLAQDGFLVVRLPTLPNTAFDAHRNHWVQIDAPRHIHIPSRDGLRKAASRSQLELIASGDDSTAFQFWGSEEYARDVALSESKLARGGWGKQPWRERRRLIRRARAANEGGIGDQAWFVFCPAATRSAISP